VTVNSLANYLAVVLDLLDELSDAPRKRNVPSHGHLKAKGSESNKSHKINKKKT
jgi:hypothetical protein